MTKKVLNATSQRDETWSPPVVRPNGNGKDVVASREAFHQLQTHEYVRYDDLPLETREHECRHVEFVSNVYMVNGTKVIQCNIRDITERKLAEDRDRQTNRDLLLAVAELQKHEREMLLLQEKLHEQANHDPLTGLFNRPTWTTACRVT